MKKIEIKNKKVAIAIAIGIVLALIIIISIIIKPQENDEEKLIKEMEKVMIYNYIEENVLEYDYLQCYKTENPQEVSNIYKVNYAVKKATKDGTKTSNVEETTETYNELFKESPEISLLEMGHPEGQYEYNIETQEIKYYETSNEKYEYTIEKIEYEKGTYTIIANEKTYNNDIIAMQGIEENSKTVKICIKIEDGKYEILSYEQEG